MIFAFAIAYTLDTLEGNCTMWYGRLGYTAIDLRSSVPASPRSFERTRKIAGVATVQACTKIQTDSREKVNGYVQDESTGPLSSKRRWKT